jgi:hypothetical protein
VHLFIELSTLTALVACVVHAVRVYGASGAWFFATVSALGFIRENFVILRDVLYGFAPLTLIAGKAPLIAAIIWGYSIYVAIVWAQNLTGERWGAGPPTARFLLLVAAFMMALACFYEPFLKLIEMARWEPGTRRFLDVPLIAMIGYPSLAVLYLMVFSAIMTRARGRERFCWFGLAIPALALGHAVGLHELKRWLAW